MKEYLAPEVEIIDNIATSTMDDGYLEPESDTDMDITL